MSSPAALASNPSGAAPSPSAPPGIVPANFSLEVTGSPAEPDFLERRIESALSEAVGPTLQPGEMVAFGPIVPALQPLEAGFLREVEVPVELIDASGSVSLRRAVNVNLVNVNVWPFDPPVLFFDDDPEKIVTDGVLFRGAVDAIRPVRLYYYHENAGRPRRIVVGLSGSSSPSTVQIIQASSGPSDDVLSVGDAASRDFLNLQPKGEGILSNVAAGEFFVVHQTSMKAGEVVAGTVDLRVLSGGPLTLLVLATPPGADPSTYAAAAPLPGDGHGRHGKFDVGGYGNPALRYTVGGPAATFIYGGRDTTPLSVGTNGGRDHGDYGVLHRITFQLTNPTGEAATVYLYEGPHSAAVRGTFLVDGRLKQLGCVRAAQHYQIATYAVPPHGTLATSVVTMTDGGSSYPLEIGVTQTPPLVQTPPISAPDGCFPKPAPTKSPA